MQRRTMRGIQERAEGAPSAVANLEPILWLLAAAVFLATAIRALIQNGRWGLPLAVAAGAIAALFALMFWQPPIAIGAALDGALVLALCSCWRSARSPRGEARIEAPPSRLASGARA